MSDSIPIARTDRRRFLMLMGLAGVASALTLPALSAAEGPAAPAAPAAPANSPAAPADSAAAAARKEPSAEARSLAEFVRQRYGTRLSEADLKAIAEDLDGRLEGGRTLRSLALANGDEPDFTFHA